MASSVRLDNDSNLVSDLIHGAWTVVGAATAPDTATL